MTAILSNPLHRRIYELIKSACEARIVSPTLVEMGRALCVENDPKGSKVKHAVDTVVKRGLIGRTGRRGTRPIYDLPGTDFRTLSPEEGFADTCGSALAAKRAAILYDYISIRARRNGFTPTYGEMGKRISQEGRSASVCYLLKILERQGKIAREGGNYDRVFSLPGTPFRTRPLPPDERARTNPFSTAGWPRPTKGSHDAYDAAVAARVFALHEVDDETAGHVRVARPGAYPRSLTGCSAELCAL